MMRMVSQAKLKIKGGGPNGQKKFITYPMEMPVSHSIYTEIQKKICGTDPGRYQKGTG